MSEHTNTDAVAADQLRSFVERIETLKEEAKAIAEQISEVKAEAKGAGFDAKALGEILRLRSMQDHDRREWEELVALYKGAVGMD